MTATAAFRTLLLAAGLVALASAQEPSGLSIEHDQAEIVLGVAGDVRLSRAEAGVLHLDGDLLLGEVRLLEVIGALQAKVLALETRATAMGKFSSEAAVTDAINEAAQGVTDGLEEVVRLGRVNETLSRAAADASTAKNVTDNLEEVVLTHAVGAMIASAAADASTAKAVTDNLEEVVRLGQVNETFASAAADAKVVTDGLDVAVKSVMAAVEPLGANGVVLNVCEEDDGSCDFATVGAAVQHAADTYSTGLVRVRVHPLAGGAHYNESEGIGALGIGLATGSIPEGKAGLHVVVECTNVGTPGACTLSMGNVPYFAGGHFPAVSVGNGNTMELRRFTLLPKAGADIAVDAHYGGRLFLEDVVVGAGFSRGILSTHNGFVWAVGCNFIDLASHGIVSHYHSTVVIWATDFEGASGNTGKGVESHFESVVFLEADVVFSGFSNDIGAAVSGLVAMVGGNIVGLNDGGVTCPTLGIVTGLSDGVDRACVNTV